MKNFIEKSLGIQTNIEDIEYNNKLPMIYSALYLFKLVRMQNIEWIIAIPKEHINLSKLRKQHRQMEKLLDLKCAIFLNSVNIYSKNTMISDGIPFIIEDREIYLPFLGILLSMTNERALKPVQKISFLTQKIILTAFYENWHDINVTETAKRMKISKMSASRCFDEIELFDIPLLTMKGKSRVINISDDKKNLWDNIKGVMRNPIISNFYISDDLQLTTSGGMSALADYTMIEDNIYPTYVVAKKDINNYKIKEKQVNIKIDKIGCLVQEVGYIIPYNDGKNIDPLSLLLSLSDEEKDDERIEKSVREMLEEYVW